MLKGFHELQSRVGLRFNDKAVEADYQAYLAARLFKLVRFSVIFGVITYAVLGIMDPDYAPAITRFRYMVACPVLCVFLVLCFTRVGHRHWQFLSLAYCLSASCCIYVTVLQFDQFTSFGKMQFGTATNNYFLAMCFLPLLPMNAGYTAVAAIFSQIAHARLLITSHEIPPQLVVQDLFSMAFVAVVVCGIAYFRDQLMRREFLRQQSMLDERDELKTQLISFVSLDALERAKRSGKPVADAFGEVTVIFCDIVGFTRLAERLAPKHLVEVLNDIFSALDQLALACRVEKVKTIGDAYMAIAGTSDDTRNSAEDAAEFALQAQAKAAALGVEIGHPLAFRIGIHTGALIGGVVGRQKMAYDYWGKTVNVASRLEATGEPGRIQVSEATYWRLNARYELERRGPMELKGIGAVETYFLNGAKPAGSSSAAGAV